MTSRVVQLRQLIEVCPGVFVNPAHVNAVQIVVTGSGYSLEVNLAGKELRVPAGPTMDLAREKSRALAQDVNNSFVMAHDPSLSKAGLNS